MDNLMKCPKCGKMVEQIKRGLNRSGTERCRCKCCGKSYTLNPKNHEIPEKTKKLTLKMFYAGVSGLGVAKILRFGKNNVYNWIKKKRKRLP
jgi:transposase-like protein